MASWLSRLTGSEPPPDPRGMQIFADHLALKGVPQDGEVPGKAHLRRLSRHLPEAFVAMLEEYGFGQFADRRFQLCDPEPFAPLVRRLFAKDQDFDPALCQLVGFDCFGRARLWTGPHFQATLDFNDMSVQCPALAPDDMPQPVLPAHIKPGASPSDRNSRARTLMPLRPDEIDFWDPFGDPVFADATAALGPLAAGEVFAFDPPLAATGGAIPRHPLERLSRKPALKAFAEAASAAPLRLVRLVRGRLEHVRAVGSGQGSW